MGREIEHKYLVKDNSYRMMAERYIDIQQGYLSRTPERVVRIRIADNNGFMTIKGLTSGDTRLEFEYSIPLNDALELMQMCIPPVICKRRYIVPHEGNIWEVDEFKSPVKDTIAEIELPESDYDYSLPPFIGENVTGNERYYNSNIR